MCIDTAKVYRKQKTDCENLEGEITLNYHIPRQLQQEMIVNPFPVKTIENRFSDSYSPPSCVLKGCVSIHTSHKTVGVLPRPTYTGEDLESKSESGELLPHNSMVCSLGHC